MYFNQPEFVRQRDHDLQQAAARRRTAHRRVAARRWQRAAAWAAHRAAMAERTPGDTDPGPDRTR